MDRILKLKEFLSTNPDDSFIQHALALEYIKQGNELEARKVFENLLSKNENYIGSYYHLARLLQKAGEKENALRCYQKGMLKAKEAGDNHAYDELQSAYEDLVY